MTWHTLVGIVDVAGSWGCGERRWGVIEGEGGGA